MLAMRVPDVRESIVRELREIVQSRDEDYDQTRLAIESALKASSFEVGASDRKSVDAYFRQLSEAKAAAD
jgi:hypothetical protein